MEPYFDVLHSVAYFKVTVCIIANCGSDKNAILRVKKITAKYGFYLCDID